ncbi:hypothetical protein FKW77_007898 [Venturia effusa]|uniref:Large ribosomal subunit protein bL27m n=1 Tax=Venturia effusa TaxID=50376 RepID=A0A517KZT1_9PEZI|nr:hypothetical protein FKW77_007898 [Venturia effusa]
MPTARLMKSLRATLPSSINRSTAFRPSSQALQYLRAVNSPANPSILFVRHASHQAQGRANGPKNSPGRRLGAKKSGEQFVVPGNIIFRQRGTKWFPGENCDMGRDHTIFATETGFVKYYRDPAKHPKRQYIGVAFERTQTLPTPPNAARRRRLGMLAVPRKEPEAIATAPLQMQGSVPRPTPVVLHHQLPSLVKSSQSITRKESEDALSAFEEKAEPKRSRRGDIVVPKPVQTREGHGLTMTSNYMFRETNAEIGRAAEKAGVKVRPFVRGDRFLAWRKTTARRAKAAEKRKLGSRKAGKKKRYRMTPRVEMKNFMPVVASLLSCVSSVHAISDTLQNILANTDKSDLYTYPTDLTRGIVPKAFHSHNDYWRDVPFYSALSAGAVSVEADVWLINGTLYVGHEISALTPARTFASLYIDPILDTIKRQNPTTQFVSSSQTKNGVFDTNSAQTLYLWIDVKTDGPTTWPAVLSDLAPLKDAGYLTTTDGNDITSSAVTAIGTGNTPKSYFIPQDPASSASPRFTFFDAQLSTLNSSAGVNVTSLITPIASAQFSAQFGDVVTEGLNSTQLDLLRNQISYAKSRGIGARYWDQPNWPLGTRNAIWRTLLEEGVTLLNVDDLEGAADFWESKG